MNFHLDYDGFIVILRYIVFLLSFVILKFNLTVFFHANQF